ncbi:MAG: redoxin domain-containing protein [Planctomycetaceae bacterium]|nr:redoxin domain-containing protein [Planctomycetaceae bacterium]
MVCSEICVSNTQADESPSPTLALSFRPVQKDVEYELIDKADHAKCKVEVERIGKASGWVVYGPQGQILRRFQDTNADNVVDRWRYYHRGYEVYRDMDSNFNNKVDQSRWMNIAGTRWGLDQNEDGKIDQWKMISAEEVTREAIQAMAAGDAARLSLVVINKNDIATLGIQPEFANKILAKVEKLPETMKTRLSQSKTINEKTKWVRFDSSMLMPFVIPADEGKAKLDLHVYENVMAIIETAGTTGFVQMGEVVRVGDVWKLTQVPAPVEGDTMQVTEGGTLMQPKVGSTTPAMTADSQVSDKTRKLLTDLQQLDGKAPTPQSSAADLATYNSLRVEILRGLLADSKTEQERTQWLTQMIDGLAAAVQTGKYVEGAKKLAAIEADLKKQRPNSELVPYTTYRRLLADYSTRIQAAQADNEKSEELHKWWLDQLKTFVTEYPKSKDSADALLQLAIFEEFSGEIDQAKQWYQKLDINHALTDSGKRAKGALKRLDMVGKPLVLKGTGIDGQPIDLSTYRGKTVLVIFWATWCQPCTEDLPQIKAIYEQYRAKGFEIIGINLDTQKEGIAPYIAQNGNSWKHITESDGLEGEAAIEFGIISVPTMFLIDPQGNVISNASSVEELKEKLPTLIK